MSRQLRFFLLPEDVLWLMAQLREKFAICILQDSSPTAGPVELTSPLVSRPANPKFRAHTAVHCYLAQSENADIRMQYFANREEWLIADPSEVIQFSGCRFDGDSLAEGRFYFHTDHLDGDTIAPMRPAFVAWGGQVFRTTKRALRYSPGLRACVGPAAATWWKNGGKLVWSIGGAPAFHGQTPDI